MDNRLITANTRYYAYDVEGTRIKTQRGEDVTKFIYNVNARLSQLLVKTENNADTKYVYGLGLIGEEVSGNFKTYHFDYRGSTVAITNANGTVTDTFDYDTYGNLTAILIMHKRLILLNCNTGLKSANCGLQAGNFLSWQAGQGGTHFAKNIKLRRSEILYFCLLGYFPSPFERTETVRQRKKLFAYYVLLSYRKLYE